MATVIAKATELCNARCAYCDVVRKDARAVQTMPPEVVEALFRRTDEYLRAHPGETLELVWHGGEPLLPGVRFYRNALRLQERLCPTTAPRIRHQLQTNFTLLTPAFAEVLRALGVSSLGTSYDPASGVRGLGAKRDSAAYGRRFLEGVAVAEEAGFPWGLIYVVTKRSLEDPLGLYRFLGNLVPEGAVMLNPVLLYGDDPEGLAITPREYVDFLGALFPTWWGERLVYPALEPFRSAVRNVIEGSKALACSDAGRCADTHLNVAPDGAASQCGRSCDWGLLDYGSILERSFDDLFADPQREQLRRRDAALREGECATCRLFELCHGGCPLDAWAARKDFLHKTSWCLAKHAFIEEVVEPVTGYRYVPGKPGEKPEHPPPAPPAPPTTVPTVARFHAERKPLWINPIGGLGDVLMISGVLKQVADARPGERFNLVTRPPYTHLLQGHPAIARAGHPPRGSSFLGTDYWHHEAYGEGPCGRAYQVLATIFGLPTPAPELLWLPGVAVPDPALVAAIPWERRNVLVAAGSTSPRKAWSKERWETLVERLLAEGATVVQLGARRDPVVRGAFSLLGLTTPRQAVALMPRFDVLVTSDNFFMHAAHMVGLPAVVLWGPSPRSIYGYPDQTHLEGRRTCATPEGCVGPGRGHLYATPCPEGDAHCVDAIAVEDVLAALALLRRPPHG